jgi:hypothetical protein
MRRPTKKTRTTKRLETRLPPHCTSKYNRSHFTTTMAPTKRCAKIGRKRKGTNGGRKKGTVPLVGPATENVSPRDGTTIASPLLEAVVPANSRSGRKIASKIKPVAAASTTGREETKAINSQIRRVTIAVFFLDVLGAPDESEWHGRRGAIATVQKIFNVPVYSKINFENVFRDAAFCHSENILYDGAINYTATVGQAPLLSTTSLVEAQSVADSMEESTTLAGPSEPSQPPNA